MPLVDNSQGKCVWNVSLPDAITAMEKFHHKLRNFKAGKHIKMEAKLASMYFYSSDGGPCKQGSSYL